MGRAAAASDRIVESLHTLDARLPELCVGVRIGGEGYGVAAGQVAKLKARVAPLQHQVAVNGVGALPLVDRVHAEQLEAAQTVE